MRCTEIDFKNIPVQSDVISGIIRLDVDSMTCFRDLDNYVSSDQGVATLVLRVVNSPFYSRGKKIATIPLAISVLGFNVVRSLSMLAFSRSLFSQTRNPRFRTHIWQHSLLTALAGHAICTDLGEPKRRDDAFVAGLMHDMGKVLMFTHSEARYGEVLDRVLAGEPSLEVEQALFGFDHCAVGTEAVTQWKLPERFLDFMGQPVSQPSPGILGDPVRLSLALANVLIRDTGVGGPALADAEARLNTLAPWGVDEALMRKWVDEAFVADLMASDTYQLCAQL